MLSAVDGFWYKYLSNIWIRRKNDFISKDEHFQSLIHISSSQNSGQWYLVRSGSICIKHFTFFLTSCQMPLFLLQLYHYPLDQVPFHFGNLFMNLETIEIVQLCLFNCLNFSFCFLCNFSTLSPNKIKSLTFSIWTFQCFMGQLIQFDYSRP